MDTDTWLNTEVFKLPFGIGSGRTILGEKNSFQLDFKVNMKEKSVVAHVNIPYEPHLQGPPMHLHGGLSAYLLDETMGTNAFVMGIPAGATNLNFSLKRMIPFDTELMITSQIVDTLENKVEIHSTLTCNNKIFIEGTGIFTVIPKRKLKLLFQISPSAEQQFLDYKSKIKELNPDTTFCYLED